MQNGHQLVSKQEDFQMVPKAKTKTKLKTMSHTPKFLRLPLGNFHLQGCLCNSIEIKPIW